MNEFERACITKFTKSWWRDEIFDCKRTRNGGGGVVGMQESC